METSKGYFSRLSPRRRNDYDILSASRRIRTISEGVQYNKARKMRRIAICKRCGMVVEFTEKAFLLLWKTSIERKKLAVEIIDELGLCECKEPFFLWNLVEVDKKITVWELQRMLK